jgi:L-gulonolactone oxidase
MALDPPVTDYTLTNWGETLECHPKEFYQPESEDDVVALVKRVAAAGRTLRVVGTGHSWSALAMTDDTLVNLDKMNRLIAVDDARKQVTVEAGIKITDLNDRLDEHGLAMANLGAISAQSIAGAISTGTHGTGITLGNLSTQIVSMTMVCADGSRLTLPDPARPDLFLAARVSLGCLGVVTRVTIQCVPKYNLHEVAYPLPFDQALDQLPSLLSANRNMKFYWFANTDVIQVITANPTDAPATPVNPVKEYFNEVVLKTDLLQFFMETGYSFPGLVGPFNKFSAKVGWQKEERVARSDKVLNITMPPKHDESEYAIPVERTAEGLRLFRKQIDEADYKLNLPVELRFVAGDENLLSPAYGGARCYIGAYTFGEQFALPLFGGFEGLMLYLGGRPHWGKYLTIDADECRRLYPRYDEFALMRGELDPNGVFVNDLIKQIFGL